MRAFALYLQGIYLSLLKILVLVVVRRYDLEKPINVAEILE